MILSQSKKEEYSKSHSEKQVLTDRKHIMNMIQSLQDEATDIRLPSSRKPRMTMSLSKVISLSLGLSALGRLGMGNDFPSQHASSTDQSTMLNPSLLTSQSLSVRDQLLAPYEILLPHKKNDRIKREYHPENAKHSQRLEMNSRSTLNSTSIEFDSNPTTAPHSNQFLINQ